MPDQKIRILGIAPYEGLKTLMSRVASEYDDIEFTVFIADLADALHILESPNVSRYDAIISRGGTAALLKKNTEIPVIEIETSFYDILSAIKLADGLPSPKAVVGFPGILKNTKLLFDVIDLALDVYPIYSTDESSDLMKTLAAKGYRTVLCDVVSSTYARQLGMSAILISSGIESVRNAFERAFMLCSVMLRTTDSVQILSRALSAQETQTLIFDEEGMLRYNSAPERNTSLISSLGKDSLTAVPGQRKTLRAGTYRLLYITWSDISGPSRRMAAFLREQDIPSFVRESGIIYDDPENVRGKYLDTFYAISGLIDSVQSFVDAASSVHAPVFITGEPGNGKEPIVFYIYNKSEQGASPLFIIDCSALNTQSWNFLMTSDRSPFLEEGCSLMIQNLECLGAERTAELLMYLKTGRSLKRNRFFFTCSLPHGAILPPHLRKLSDELACITYTPVPLRDKASRIPELVNLYMSQMNLELGKNLLGIEADGLSLMMRYDWPGNYAQFKRFLKNLAVYSDGPFITAEAVSEAIAQEKREAAPVVKASSAGPDLSRTMAEIEREIASIVLGEEHGNQSAAARRLGISRTTMWRLLK